MTLLYSYSHDVRVGLVYVRKGGICFISGEKNCIIPLEKGLAFMSVEIGLTLFQVKRDFITKEKELALS